MIIKPAPDSVGSSTGRSGWDLNTYSSVHYKQEICLINRWYAPPSGVPKMHRFCVGQYVSEIQRGRLRNIADPDPDTYVS